MNDQHQHHSDQTSAAAARTTESQPSHERAGHEHTGHEQHHGHDMHTAHDAHAGHDAHDAHDAVTAARTEHTGHGDHGGHSGHGDHVGQFRRLFWINLILAVPVVAFSPMFAMVIGYELPDQPWLAWISPVLGTVMYVWGGRPFLTGAVSEIRALKPGMMLLIGLAITVAFLASWGATLGLLDHQLDFWWELALLIVIMLLGHWLEMRSLAQTTSALDSLAALLPDEAERVDGDTTVTVPPSDLRVGDVVVVRPGGRVPADGRVVAGSASVDESMITGESKPVRRSEGDAGRRRNRRHGLRRSESKSPPSATTPPWPASSGWSPRRRTPHPAPSGSPTRQPRHCSGSRSVPPSSPRSCGRSSAIPTKAVVRTITVLVIACPHALGLAIPLVVSSRPNAPRAAAC